MIVIAKTVESSIFFEFKKNRCNSDDRKPFDSFSFFFPFISFFIFFILVDKFNKFKGCTEK